jgi:hypothetical protein
MISPAEFARTLGVSKQAVSKAIRAGRVLVYDETGARCAADYAGRKFVDLEEGRTAFRLSRSRVDDHMLAEIAAETEAEVDRLDDRPPLATAAVPPAGTLTGVKTEKEQLQSELLRLRIARERGELIARQAQIDAFEQAGRRVANELQSIPQWAEEITSIAHASGVAGVTAFLRAKGSAFCTRLADLMVADEDTDGNDDECEGDDTD